MDVAKSSIVLALEIETMIRAVQGRTQHASYLLTKDLKLDRCYD